MLLSLIMNLGMAAGTFEEPATPPAPISSGSGGGGGGGLGGDYWDRELEHKEEKERIDKINYDDNYVIEIIKIFINEN